MHRVTQISRVAGVPNKNVAERVDWLPIKGTDWTYNSKRFKGDEPLQRTRSATSLETSLLRMAPAVAHNAKDGRQ
ncbi:hypothetical protein OF83DRAFT_1158164 [Amylostereum chailletii]|nr:hypothetical protein OF83DRAFT_1158164 [Amylostereum chailletii]